MNFEYEIRENPSYIFYKISGELTFLSLIEVFKEVDIIAKKTGVTDVIADYQDVIPSIHMASVFEIPEQLELSGMPINSRTAVLYNKNSETEDKFEMFISLAHEKGQAIEIFTDEEKAFKWFHLNKKSED